MQTEFRAVVIRSRDAAPVLESLPIAALPAGDVLIDVHYSTLNYKDGLALTTPSKVLRTYPLAPGVDLAGVVLESASPEYRPGDAVVVTGGGLGETHWGGYSELTRVSADPVVPLPPALTLKHAMAIGTAGVTAMLCVIALERHGLKPGGRPVVVTGAVGGVGTMAVELLSKLGYRVTAVTGRLHEHEYLRRLGASEIVGRDEVLKLREKPLQSARWSGAVDVAGGDLMAALFPAIAPGGSVAACGMAGGTTFQASVLPFILRGVNLLGINSVYIPREERREAWSRLAAMLSDADLERVSRVVPLADVIPLGREILRGAVRGRIVVDVRAS